MIDRALSANGIVNSDFYGEVKGYYMCIQTYLPQEYKRSRIRIHDLYMSFAFVGCLGVYEVCHHMTALTPIVIAVSCVLAIFCPAAEIHRGCLDVGQKVYFVRGHRAREGEERVVARRCRLMMRSC